MTYSDQTGSNKVATTLLALNMLKMMDRYTLEARQAVAAANATTPLQKTSMLGMIPTKQKQLEMQPPEKQLAEKKKQIN